MSEPFQIELYSTLVWVSGWLLPLNLI